ncbi:MAG: class I SAM-dependent methyltransferase [Candidatus Babeliales bacterium]
MTKGSNSVNFYNNMFVHDHYEVHRHDVGSYCTRKEILSAIAHTSGSVLEVGTGISTLLEDLPTFQRFGIDISPTTIDRVHHIFNHKGIVADVRVADATHLPFPDQSFDVIVSSHVLEHIEDDSTCLQECARVLKPGGELILWVPGRINGQATEAEWQKNGHYRMYNKKRFVELEQCLLHSLKITSLCYPHKIHNLIWNRGKRIVRWINYPLKKYILRDHKTYEVRPFYQKIILPLFAALLNSCDKLTRSTEKNFLGAEFNMLVRFEKQP